MLLLRSPGVRKLPKHEWIARLAAFNEGRWTQLLEEAQPLQLPVPRAEVATPEALAARAAQRARHLVHLGELSAARQALTSSALAQAPARLSRSFVIPIGAQPSRMVARVLLDDEGASDLCCAGPEMRQGHSASGAWSLSKNQTAESGAS